MSDSAVEETRGVTWRPPCRFASRLAVATVGAAALVMGLAVPAAGPAVEATAPVGSLSTSMVEMLDDDGGYGSTMTLDELRDEVLDRYYNGNDGTGIDVAVIDTGVAPVSGLDGDKVLHGPDLSFEGQTPEVAYLDTYGHGTHMAAIIAGDRPGHEGIAPGARIVSVKVAGHDGLTTVPQVVAAIDWVIDHRNTDGLNIRVLNLSLGQAGVVSHVGDHLSAAVERAWDAGIFVVVAAGNDGGSQAHLDSPAIDPYVMAVGAADIDEDREDSDVPTWSGRGNGDRNPSVVAPGLSIASYRVPGSTIDTAVPSARYGDDLFKGTGTSQAAAATSGLAAVILAEHPALTPDQLKDTINHYADSIESGHSRDGEGLIDDDTADRSPITSGTPQNHLKANGPASGLVTPSGATWSGGTWSGGTWSGATWSGATWSGGTWSGATWSGATWSGATWSGATWSGGTWSGATWSGATWSGATWSGATWSANGWS